VQCSTCNKKIPGNIRYCPYCGSAVHPSVVLTFRRLFLRGLVVWVILIVLDVFIRKDSYYLNPQESPLLGVLLSTTSLVSTWREEGRKLIDHDPSHEVLEQP
jgi:hypothetical protein